MHEKRGLGMRAAAFCAAITLVCLAGFGGTHVHGVGHAEQNGPVLTASGRAESTAFVCLSCQLTHSPLEEVGPPAAPDRIEPRGDGLLPVDSGLPASSFLRSGCSRAPPCLL